MFSQKRDNLSPKSYHIPSIRYYFPPKSISTPKCVNSRILPLTLASRINTLFVIKSTKCARIEGWGVETNFGNVKILKAPVTVTPPKTLCVYSIDDFSNFHKTFDL